MTVSEEEVLHVATLARLQFTPEEVSELAREMSVILGYAARLSKLDTEHVEPMTHVLDLSGAVREDVVASTAGVNEALLNAPDVLGDYFRVPKVIGD